MTEPEPGAMLPPDPDPLADLDDPVPADDGLDVDAPEHDAESVSPGGSAMPDDGPDDEAHAVSSEVGGLAADDEAEIGGEG